MDLESFQNIDMEDVIKYLTYGRGSWNYRSNTKLPTNFNQAIMFPVAKMWMQFIGIRIVPALNVSNVNETGPVLQEFARTNGLRAPCYPPDMLRLTPTHQDEGDNHEEEGAAQEYPGTEDEYVAYVELQAKQRKDWKKRQQDATITPASSQRLTQAQQEIGERSHPMPTNIEQKEEVPESEEEGEDEEEDGSEEIDFEEGD
ncbi:hypothetical protein Gotri_022614 [Gossypium trilobum]|uniref:Uncharacterized protein n=1 Tax=Gossypium trilobum TaxID=34281 RepID=A0A7J9DG96_9ROSI|nr:hypothetical protein [Gossypium trilobum]